VQTRATARISQRSQQSERLGFVAVEASDVNGLIALAADDIVLGQWKRQTAPGVDVLRAELTHDFGFLDLELRDSSAEIIS
jgi:hypothetical protein